MSPEDRVLSALITDLRSKQLGLFVGAGVSMCSPSSLPNWSALKMSFLNALLLSLANEPLVTEHNITDRLLNWQFPPELLFEVLCELDASTTKKAVARRLSEAAPNPVHKLAAVLAQRGFIRVIITTNFDNLFEKALNETGTKFVSLATEAEFEGFLTFGAEHFLNPGFVIPKTSPILPHMVIAESPSPAQIELERSLTESFNAPIILVKLHGTVNNPDSMLLTESETSEGMSRGRMDTLRFFLSQYHMLYLGYSGSDLDISPLISQAKQTYDTANTAAIRLMVPFDQHDAMSIPVEVFQLENVPARRAYWVALPGQARTGNSITRVLSTYGDQGTLLEITLEDLTGHLQSSMPELSITAEEVVFASDGSQPVFDESSLLDWANSLSYAHRLIDLAKLFSTKQEMELATVLAAKAEACAADDFERSRAGWLLLNLQLAQGLHVDLIDNLLRLKEAALNTGDGSLVIQFLLQEGQVLLRLNLIKDAERVFEDVLVYLGASQPRRGCLDFLLRPGRTMVSSPMVATIGGLENDERVPVWRASALNGMATVLTTKRQFRHAVHVLQAAKAQLDPIRFGSRGITKGTANLICAVTTNLAYCLNKIGQSDQAATELLQALNDAATTQQPDVQLLILDRLAQHYASSGDVEKARFYLAKAEQLHERGIRKVDFVNIDEVR